MKNPPIIFGTLAIFLFSWVHVWSQNQNLSMADQLHQGRDSIRVLYMSAYYDVLSCPRADAVFDTMCYINLSNRFRVTGQFLYQYAKLLKQNENPIWIDGKPYFLFVPFEVPSGEEMEQVADKFEKAATSVLACVRGHATENTCRLVGPSVSDAVNSLAKAMGWLKK